MSLNVLTFKKATYRIPLVVFKKNNKNEGLEKN